MGYYGFFSGYLRVNYGFGKTGFFGKEGFMVFYGFFMGYLWVITEHPRKHHTSIIIVVKFVDGCYQDRSN